MTVRMGWVAEAAGRCPEERSSLRSYGHLLRVAEGEHCREGRDGRGLGRLLFPWDGDACRPPLQHNICLYLHQCSQRAVQLPLHVRPPSHTGTSTRGEKAEGSGPNTKKLLFAHACVIHLSRDNTVVKDLTSEPALVSKHSFRKCHLNSTQKFTLLVPTFR